MGVLSQINDYPQLFTGWGLSVLNIFSFYSKKSQILNWSEGCVRNKFCSYFVSVRNRGEGWGGGGCSDFEVVSKMKKVYKCFQILFMKIHLRIFRKIETRAGFLGRVCRNFKVVSQSNSCFLISQISILHRLNNFIISFFVLC